MCIRDRPLDEKMLDRLAKEHSLLVTMEENVQKGGFGSAVLDYMPVSYTHLDVYKRQVLLKELKSWMLTASM